MNIGDACKIIRQWDDLFVTGRTAPVQPKQLVLAVAEVKRYLESTRQHRMSIRELAIAEHILWTPEGVRQTMPFVLQAEALEAAAGRDGTPR